MPLERRFPQRRAGVHDLDGNIASVQGNEIAFSLRNNGYFDRTMIPVDPKQAWLDSHDIDQVFPTIDLRFNLTGAFRVQFDFQLLAINNRGVLHEFLSPRRRASSFQGL